MIIDILSDTHFNAWSKKLCPTSKEVKTLWDRFEPKGEVLIIAGDIGEIPLQNVNFLKTLKELYYKEIICVLGNHDLHCLYNRTLYLYDENHELIQIKGWNEYHDKIQESKALYKEAGIHLLDGDTIAIDGIVIGGSMGWYDGAYTKTHRIDLGKHHFFRYREYEDIQELWKASMPDDDIKPLGRFDGLFKEEYTKLDAIVEKCDIMITHINPSLHPHHQNQVWSHSPTCGFYSFNGAALMERFKGSHWIFGHSHYSDRYTIQRERVQGSFELMANAMGYPSENPRDVPKIMSVEVDTVNV